jgi:hypothetical protein
MAARNMRRPQSKGEAERIGVARPDVKVVHLTPLKVINSAHGSVTEGKETRKLSSELNDHLLFPDCTFNNQRESLA